MKQKNNQKTTKKQQKDKPTNKKTKQIKECVKRWFLFK